MEEAKAVVDANENNFSKSFKVAKSENSKHFSIFSFFSKKN